MTQRQFFDWQALGGAKDVSRLVAALEEQEVKWCMIDGLAVNHWAEEPMATADVDPVIAAEQIEDSAKVFRNLGFTEKRLDYSINFKGDTKVSIQISTEQMYLSFPERSVPASVHGILMHVASLSDTLKGKLAACSAPEQRKTKKLKDLLDISRLVEAHPKLVNEVPKEIRAKLEDI